MLRALDFNITVPSLFRFLERYSKLANSDDLIFNFSRFLIEMSLLDIKMYKYRPSLIACSSIVLARKIMQRPNPWSQTLAASSGYSDSQIRECCRELCYMLGDKKNTNNVSLFKKFSTAKYLEVAKLVPNYSLVREEETN